MTFCHDVVGMANVVVVANVVCVANVVIVDDVVRDDALGGVMDQLLCVDGRALLDETYDSTINVGYI